MDRPRYRDDRQTGQSVYRSYQDDRSSRYDMKKSSSYDDYDDDQYYDKSPSKRRRRDDFDSRGDYRDEQPYSKPSYRTEEQYFTRKESSHENDDWLDDRRGGGNYDKYQRDSDYESRSSRNSEYRKSYDKYSTRRESDSYHRRDGGGGGGGGGGGFSRSDSSSRRGYDRGRGGYDQGRGRGNFERGRSSYERGRGRGNYNRGGYDRGRGGYDRGRGGYDRGRGSYDRGRGSYERRDSYDRKDNYDRKDAYERRDYRPSLHRPDSGMKRYHDYDRRDDHGYRGRGRFERRDDGYHRRPYRGRSRYEKRGDYPSSSEWSGVDDGDEDDKEESSKVEDGDEKAEEENKVSSTHVEEDSPPTEAEISELSKEKTDDLASSILLLLFDQFNGQTSLNMLRLELILKDIAIFNTSTKLKAFLKKYRTVFKLKYAEEAEADAKDEERDETREELGEEGDGEEEEGKEVKMEEEAEEEEAAPAEAEAEPDPAEAEAEPEEGKEAEAEEKEMEAEEEVQEEDKVEVVDEVKEEGEAEEDKEEPGSSTQISEEADKNDNEEEDGEKKEEGGEHVDKEGSEDGNENPDDDLLTVIATPTLRLCVSHSIKSGSCVGKCKALHVCRYFVLSKCEVVDTGKRCMFGHDMDSKYNKYIMRKSLLQKFPPRMAQKVLLNLKYRNRTTLPVVCRYYNTFYGCKNSRTNSCPFLHICEAYVLGYCKYDSKRCRNRHDITENQPATILERYGMTVCEKYPKTEILKALKRSIQNRNRDDAERRRPQRSRSVASAASDTENAEKLEEGVTYETKWKWQCRSTQQAGCAWLDIDESNKIEEKYTLYMKTKKYTFIMGERESELNFDRLNGHTTGGIHLEFQRVKERIPIKTEEKPDAKAEPKKAEEKVEEKTEEKSDAPATSEPEVKSEAENNSDTEMKSEPEEAEKDDV